jgi:hypothetical protein
VGLKTFLLSALIGLALAAGLLVLAGATDEPVLYVLAVAAIGLVLVAEALWKWSD